MIFNELYSAYYNAVAAILSDIINGQNDEKELQKTIMKHAFSESILTIMPYLKSGRWQLIRDDMTTPIKNVPSMPLTLLENRWLKAISLDLRMKLFDISFDWLDNIKPLFTPDDYVVYDKYADGDSYCDEGYIKRFRIILKAVKEKQSLEICIINRKGNTVKINVMPHHLEYSEKDDKFRLIVTGNRFSTINLARILECKPYTDKIPVNESKAEENYQTVTLKILDERNAMQRCMMHFAHFKKQAEKIDDRHYILNVRYNIFDETEIVIRVLAFGPLIEVAGPDKFRNLIIERLKKQKEILKN